MGSVHHRQDDLTHHLCCWARLQWHSGRCDGMSVEVHILRQLARPVVAISTAVRGCQAARMALPHVNRRLGLNGFAQHPLRCDLPGMLQRLSTLAGD
jgi:hypothetical protein